MRFRAHQDAAQASTRRLLVLFALVVAVLVLAVNAVLAVAYWVSMPFVGFPDWFFETNSGLVLLYVLGGCWFETLRLRDGGGMRLASAISCTMLANRRSRRSAACWPEVCTGLPPAILATCAPPSRRRSVSNQQPPST